MTEVTILHTQILLWHRINLTVVSYYVSFLTQNILLKLLSCFIIMQRLTRRVSVTRTTNRSLCLAARYTNVSTNAAVLQLHCFANERMTAETQQLARAERWCDHIALADKRGARASERASESVPIADGKPSSTTLSAAEN